MITLVTCTQLTLNEMGLNYKYITVERENITWKIYLPVCNSHDQQCLLDYAFCVQAGKSEMPIFFPTARAANWGDGIEYEAREQSCTNTIIGLAFTGPLSP